MIRGGDDDHGGYVVLMLPEDAQLEVGSMIKVRGAWSMVSVELKLVTKKTLDGDLVVT